MAIDPVSYNGKSVIIESGNAKEIYKAYINGEVELNAAQKKYAESFLTRADYDEIDYDTTMANKEGREQIPDAEKADNAKNQTGNAIGTSVGIEATAAGAVALTIIAVTVSSISGWVAILMGAGATLCAYGCKELVKLYDSEYANRTQAKDNAEATNETLDANASVLEDSMEAMNGDKENYLAQSEAYTKAVNTRTSDVASLQIQLKDAEAAGDTEGAANINKQISQLNGAGFDAEEAALEETRAQMDEYENANSAASGVGNAGQSVSSFLQEGTILGVGATADTVLLGVASGLSAYAIASSTLGAASDASHFDFAGSAAGMIAAGLFGTASGLLGAASKDMGTKAKAEFECGTSGKDMQEHVNSLNDMLGQQEGYIDTTMGAYDSADAESSNNQEKAKQAAAKAVNGGGGTQTPNKEGEGEGQETNV